MKLILTKDGSHSIELEGDAGLTYHSRHGAIAESNHVYIQTGLQYYLDNYPSGKVRIFEMGFGTGLNALLTFQFANERAIAIEYTALEIEPISADYYSLLNYTQADVLKAYDAVFREMHTSPWNVPVALSSFFQLKKIEGDITSFVPDGKYDLIYFDAFGPVHIPEQWSNKVFSRLYAALDKPGLLVTYSSKSIIRRALAEAGFSVEKCPGPHGKREIVRALKA